MYLQVNDLLKCRCKARDGEVGKVKDIYFDDNNFNVRYFVVSSKKWTPGEKVLLTPEVVSVVDLQKKQVFIDLSCEEVEKAPPMSTKLPLSRQYEKSLFEYHGWAPYWTDNTGVFGWHPYPGYTYPVNSRIRTQEDWPKEWISIIESRRKQFDSNLRSCKEISGYKINTSDKFTFGEISDFIVDAGRWFIVDLVLSSRKWIPGGKEFTCSPLFITEFSFTEMCIKLEISKEMLMNSPEYESSAYGEDFHNRVVNYYLDIEDKKSKLSSNEFVESRKGEYISS